MTEGKENTKYLYGASVQGIQDFIFQTNELKDIIGASGLVEQICKNEFKKFVGTGNWIVKAAGKITCVFSSAEECKNAVKNFPKKVMAMAPGITINQAVVEIKSDFKDAVKQLNKNLEIQRNRPVQSLSLGVMGMVRSRKTGLPAVKCKIDADTKTKVYIDEATKKKQAENEFVKILCKNCFGNNVDYGKIAFDIDKMTEKNDWIAIVHIDGNGFGKITQNIENDEDKLKIFSSKLDDVTKEAAQFAFKELNLDLNKTIPVRPIILGGDDLTIICRADLAIKYTKVFMESFETKSKASLKEGLEETGLEKLTTCAGIAFIKSSYPFYYGYDLAEELCNQAKNDAKKHLVNGLAPSCLMFHKVQDSFVDNYETIVERELTTLKGISFKYGPYYLSETKEHADKKTVTSLLDIAEKLEKDSEGNALKSHFREWISLLFTNPDRAKQAVDRMRVIFNKDELINKVTDLSNKETPVYDILSLQSVIYQETKDNNKENQ